MPSFCNYDRSSFRDQFTRLGIPTIHAGKILRNFYQNAGEVDLTIEDIGRAALNWLATQRPLLMSTIDRRTTSGDGTTKLLIRFPDAAAVECVLMPTRRADR